MTPRRTAKPRKRLPPTSEDRRNAADVCRAHGWGVGTRLVGDEGHGADVITVTAIGRDEILAIADGSEYEDNWTLSCRDWSEVEQKPPRPPRGIVALFLVDWSVEALARDRCDRLHGLARTCGGCVEFVESTIRRELRRRGKRADRR